MSALRRLRELHGGQHLLELLARVEARQNGLDLAGTHLVEGCGALGVDLQPEIAEIAQLTPSQPPPFSWKMGEVPEHGEGGGGWGSRCPPR